MNFQQFALFALVSLCLFSCSLSQADSGSTSGGYLRFHSVRAAAAVANITEEIGVTTTLAVQQNGTGSPVNTTDPVAQAAINNSVNFIETGYKIAPTKVTFEVNNATYATELSFVVVWKNNDTSSANSTYSNLFLATNTTNVTQQADFLTDLVNQIFATHLNASLLESGINVTNISSWSKVTFVQPTPNGTTSTSTGGSTNGTTTSHTSPATTLSLSSWMCVGTLLCLVFTYLF